MEDNVNIKLYPKILEKSLIALGLPIKYSLIGDGLFGQAFLSGNKVYKITSDKSEAVESSKLIGKNNSHIANIFAVKKIDSKLTDKNLYLIILEYLDTNKINLFKQIENKLNKVFNNAFDLNHLDLLFYYRFDIEKYNKEFKDEINRLLEPIQREKYYFNSLLEIVDELKANGIESLDIQYHNLGLKSNGKIAFFDIGFGDENEREIEKLSISERVKTFMDNSSSVQVKRNCQLAGKGNTSDACNQGDIKNFTIKQLKEEINGFDLKTFDSLKSFAARKKYADQYLQKLGTGSSRIVYKLENDKVLKLASNNKGLEQNRNECGIGQDHYFEDMVSKVFDCHNDDLWIVSEFVKKISPQRFKELTGVDMQNLFYYLKNYEQEYNSQRAIFAIPQEIETEIRENDYVSKLVELMSSYDLTAGDLGKINSFGEVIRNGQPDVVLSDYGLNNSTWNTHYAKKRNIREDYFGDMNEEEIDIKSLPFNNDIEKAGGKIYSVGGAVRDKLLGKKSKDLDILITGIPLDKLENILSKYGKVDSVGKSFGIIKFNTPETGEIDIAIPRIERKNNQGGYQGFDVTSDHNLPIEKDLERRDFSINAIAKDLSGAMIDPYGGQNDIEKKLIRMVNPNAFSDDPLRMLRAIQFSSRFGFTIEDNTLKSIQSNAEKIKEISPERILIEFEKIVSKGNPLIGAKLLVESGLYRHIFGVEPKLNYDMFDKVRTMGEFVYLLIRNAIISPSEFYKKKLNGDLDTYNEIRALEIAGGIKNNEHIYKKIFDVYKIYPNVIETDLFNGIVKNTASEMKSKNIPLSLKELSINGNDLIGLGYSGKEIGDKFIQILNKIYKEELKNDKTEILSYLKLNR